MSGFLVVAALLAVRPAGAADAVARAQDDLDARHRIGLQLGGSSFVQIVYRLRMFSHVYLDLGAGGAPHALLNASAGIVVARSTGTRFYPYAAGGAGFGLSGGATSNADGESCYSATSKCPWESNSLSYWYARGGVAMMLDPRRRVSLALDVGTWVGTKWHASDAGMGNRTSSSAKIIWPMAGLAGFFSF